ncbi:hypothetical protein [Paracoccus tegillarcae]|uniref:Uncharacterized protein n=1 Tax=Paracoccus tegillarcae TaxID=1529068 RepID=A0A2K9EUT2_9RHOB|nr:hypothetical protein [Paracoccus tegillarcae]AUH33004.1 hypothetical protein CUV01_06000 [Paracoccus tegillarcae]
MSEGWRNVRPSDFAFLTSRFSCIRTVACGLWHDATGEEHNVLGVWGQPTHLSLHDKLDEAGIDSVGRDALKQAEDAGHRGSRIRSGASDLAHQIWRIWACATIAPVATPPGAPP